MKRFQDREEAGRLLAEKLLHYANNPAVLVLGLPRGGIPVAYQIAKRLDAKLDAMIVRKLGVPGHEELAMGAIIADDVAVFNPGVVRNALASDEELKQVVQREREELKRRNKLYRPGQKPLDVVNRIVILVDDGLATGASMRVAVKALKKNHLTRLIIAVPVAAATECKSLRAEVDEMICLMTPEPFYGVGNWYEDFRQTSDAEVCQYLSNSL